MPADSWPELLIRSEQLTALYTKLPPLERLVLRSVHLSPYGPGAKLRVELPRFPDLAPPAWTEADCDRFEVQIEFMAVGEDLRMRGVPDRTVADIDLNPFIQGEERRIAVAVTGPGFSLGFTAHAALKASHLNAYLSGDKDPYAARRWFAGRVDQHLHQVAIGALLPGASSWQRCRTHYARNLLSQLPKSAQPWVATLLRTVFEQPDADAVKAQMRHVPDAKEAKFPKAAERLDAAQHDLLAFTAFPREIWRQIWSNNPQERLNKEIRRANVVGIFPDRTAPIRLVGAVLAERNDEWTEARRYMGLDLLTKAHLHPIEPETDDTALPTELTA